MRSRNIKPAFFINSELSEVDFQSRLLFIGLWCYSDREGRFEWKPKQIKAAIFPYDNVDIEKMLCNLMSLHLITRHDTTGHIPCFKKHQHPHPHEPKSVLPELPNDFNVIACNTNVIACQEDIRIKDIRIKDSSGATNNFVDRDEGFNLFWDAFDYKKGKGGAEKSWAAIKGYSQTLLNTILESAKAEAKTRQMVIKRGGSPKWAQGWLTEKRWEDDYSEPMELAATSQPQESALERYRKMGLNV